MIVLRILWALVVVTTPLLGVWLASSLATYWGGPRWAALAAGTFLFPVGPILWELWARQNRAAKNKRRAAKDLPPKKVWLKPSDRFVWRTLAINVLFVGVLVGVDPGAVFPALSTRGAWFLDGNEHPVAVRGRDAVHFAAGSLEWLYRLSNPNPYENLGEGDDDDDVDPEPTPEPVPEPTPEPVPDPKPDPDPDPKPDSDPTPAPSFDKWRQPAKLHPAVARAPTGKVTINELGRFFKTIKDPYERVRAMHDWVAEHISYDWPAIDDKTYPTKQSAKTVLAARRGVCSGYSNLMIALGKVTGDRMLYVTGYTRTENGELDDDVGHAWNAVMINRRWYLMDVTWDSGKQLGRPNGKFRTTYFLTPPRAFLLDHFPDKTKWQLLKTPVSTGDFLRQPLMDAGSFAWGVSIAAPKTGRGTTTKNARITLGNPAGAFILAKTTGPDAKVRDCTVNPTKTTVDCKTPTTGRYRLKLYANHKRAGSYEYIGNVLVDRE